MCSRLPKQSARRAISHGSWVDRLTALKNAHIFGEHLALPGFGEGGPTLELFGYDAVLPRTVCAVNAAGFSHIAFAVDNVEETLRAVLERSGGRIGEVVHAYYPDGRKASFVYATDPEGNILELQSWR
jgi:catechol 2,3-dioxygenase-like lactoylglutathione lyase family enzyme